MRNAYQNFNLFQLNLFEHIIFNGVTKRRFLLEMYELFEYESGMIRFDLDFNLYNSNMNYSKI